MDDILWRERKRVWCGLPWTFTKYQITKESSQLKVVCLQRLKMR